METYLKPRSYLFDELRRIDLVLFYHIQRSRLEHRGQVSDEFRGLYISEEEIDGLFGGSQGRMAESPFNSEPENLERIKIAIQNKRKENELKKEEAVRRGIVFPLDKLAQTLDLNAFDREALLLALGPELHLKYERIYAYLQDNVTKRRPTVDLLLTLSCHNFEEKMDYRSRFCHYAPLMDNGILNIFDEPGAIYQPLLAKSVKVDDNIVDFLLDKNTVDARLKPFSTFVSPEISIESLPLENSVLDRLADFGDRMGKHHRDSVEGLFFYFNGPYGSGKRISGEALCHNAGLSMLFIDVKKLILSPADPAETIGLILREAKLKNAGIYVSEVNHLFAHSERIQDWNYTLFRSIQSYRGLVIFSGADQRGDHFFVEGLPLIRVEFPLPSYKMRKRLWQKHLNDMDTEPEPADVSELATRFRLTSGQIRDIVRTARVNKRDGHKNNQIPLDDLFETCRSCTRHKLVSLTVKVKPRRSWKDIVLPKDQMEILQEICKYVKHQSTVLDAWGFGKKLVFSKGLNVLFAGPSGTGKTMAAEILAGELGLDLYRIDLSTVVSKYIGETEKNLDRIFREAEHSNAILFFDEADALFGKRSEVKDSHDRYANIEISYLLQKMETYDGIAILATNLRKNLDKAFVRRMHFTIHFPFPEEKDRMRIWKAIWPPETPRADDLDLAFMAKQFKFAGGNIKNIALAAAFLAAEDGHLVGMDHLIWATKREFQKMGKVCVETDFGPYYPLIADC